MEPSQFTHVNSARCPDAPIDPFPKEGPAMGWTAATRRGRFCAATESPSERCGWEGGCWERVTGSEKCWGRCGSLFFNWKKREEKQQIDGITIYEYRSNTMPILGVH